MAFAQKTTSSTFPVIYNVEKAVGLQSPNGQADVRLVQYMLRHYYNAAGIAVDGWIGSITTGYIKKFQADMVQAGNHVMQDGRIDRAFGKQSTVSKTIYTIAMLNFALQRRNPQAYAQIPQKVMLSQDPAANPYNPASSSGNGVVSTVMVEGTSSGVKVTEVHYGAGGNFTVIYTIPYFS